MRFLSFKHSKNSSKFMIIEHGLLSWIYILNYEGTKKLLPQEEKPRLGKYGEYILISEVFRKSYYSCHFHWLYVSH